MEYLSWTILRNFDQSKIFTVLFLFFFLKIFRHVFQTYEDDVDWPLCFGIGVACMVVTALWKIYSILTRFGFFAYRYKHGIKCKCKLVIFTFCWWFLPQGNRIGPVCVSVCLSVCLSERSHGWTAWPMASDSRVRPGSTIPWTSESQLTALKRTVHEGDVGGTWTLRCFHFPHIPRLISDHLCEGELDLSQILYMTRRSRVRYETENLASTRRYPNQIIISFRYHCVQARFSVSHLTWVCLVRYEHRIWMVRWTKHDALHTHTLLWKSGQIPLKVDLRKFYRGSCVWRASRLVHRRMEPDSPSSKNLYNVKFLPTPN